jgi:uncharacterized LabA/DUF88 family protein
MKYAVLIDGGFIRRKLGSRAEPTTLAQIISFLDGLKSHPALAHSSLHRIYWYDAPPLESSARRPLKGGRVDFSRTTLAENSRALMHGLSALLHVSLRRGELVFRGWRVRRGRLPERDSTVTLAAPDLEPNIQQKGVDMRIGLDIAALTMKGHADAIVLVAGDSDFVPAMKFARREGAQLYLVTLGHTVRAEMLEHADIVLSVETERAPVRRNRETHAA